MDKRKCMLLMLCVLFFGLNWNRIALVQAKSIAGDCIVTDQNAVVEETETDFNRGNEQLQGNVRTASSDKMTYTDTDVNGVK